MNHFPKDQARWPLWEKMINELSQELSSGALTAEHAEKESGEKIQKLKALLEFQARSSRVSEAEAKARVQFALDSHTERPDLQNTAKATTLADKMTLFRALNEEAKQPAPPEQTPQSAPAKSPDLNQQIAGILAYLEAGGDRIRNLQQMVEQLKALDTNLAEAIQSKEELTKKRDGLAEAAQAKLESQPELSEKVKAAIDEYRKKNSASAVLLEQSYAQLTEMKKLLTETIKTAERLREEEIKLAGQALDKVADATPEEAAKRKERVFSRAAERGVVSDKEAALLEKRLDQAPPLVKQLYQRLLKASDGELGRFLSMGDNSNYLLITKKERDIVWLHDGAFSVLRLDDVISRLKDKPSITWDELRKIGFVDENRMYDPDLNQGEGGWVKKN